MITREKGDCVLFLTARVIACRIMHGGGLDLRISKKTRERGKVVEQHCRKLHACIVVCCGVLCCAVQSPLAARRRTVPRFGA